MQEKYNIFISYRERDGLYFSENLKIKLQLRGYNSIYFNPEHKVMGEFPERLRNAIESCTDFILVVSPGTVDGFVNRKFENDFVQQELYYAYEYGKNIVPIMLEGCSWPEKEKLNSKIAQIHDKEAISFIMEYHEAAINRIIDSLKSHPEKEKETNDNSLVESVPEVLSDVEKKRISELLQEESYGSVECFEAKNALLLGRAYESGEQVTANYEKAKYYYHISDYYGVKDAKFYYARLMLEKFVSDVDINDCLSTIKQFADDGHVGACLYYGNLLFDGRNIEKQESEAVKYWRVAESKGNPEAEYYLAFCYVNCLGVERDYDLARMLLEKSNAQSFPRAPRLMGYMYRDGHGYKKSIERAVFCFKEAIKRGDIRSHIYLGNLYYWECKEYEEAFIHYSLAADHGLADGMYNLAWAYYEGKGTKTDYHLALKWFFAAAEAGNESSKTQIKNAIIKATEENSKERLECLQKAINLGCYDVCYYMYLIYSGYLLKDIVQVDEDKAHKYLQLGSENDDTYCLFRLAEDSSTVIMNTKYKDHKKSLSLYKKYFELVEEGENTLRNQDFKYIQACYYYTLELIVDGDLDLATIYIQKGLEVSNHFYPSYNALLKGVAGIYGDETSNGINKNMPFAIKLFRVLSVPYRNQIKIPDADKDETDYSNGYWFVYQNNMLALSNTCDEIAKFYSKKKDTKNLAIWMGNAVDALVKVMPSRYNAPGQTHNEMNEKVLISLKELISKYCGFFSRNKRLDWMSFRTRTLLNEDIVRDIIITHFNEKKYPDSFFENILAYDQKINDNHSQTYLLLTEDGLCSASLMINQNARINEEENKNEVFDEQSFVHKKKTIRFIPEGPVSSSGKYLIQFSVNNCINIESIQVKIDGIIPFLLDEEKIWPETKKVINLSMEPKQMYSIEFEFAYSMIKRMISKRKDPLHSFPYVCGATFTIEDKNLIDENKDGSIEISDVIISKTK